jgi:16S rRNA (guanine527-N7)-methyltransferase
LQPFLAEAEFPSQLLDQLQLYLNLLLRWNARVSLTSVRNPEQIVTRHFGESLFAARVLTRHPGSRAAKPRSLVDIGSGAGFPGVPIKLLIPEVELTLIESQNKKATFLREVVRTLELENVQVFGGRAEQWHSSADIVTIRAVEQFARVVPVAADLVSEQGMLCLLIGEDQIKASRSLLSEGWEWAEPVAVPNSAARRIVVAQRAA